MNKKKVFGLVFSLFLLGTSSVYAHTLSINSKISNDVAYAKVYRVYECARCGWSELPEAGKLPSSKTCIRAVGSDKSHDWRVVETIRE